VLREHPFILDWVAEPVLVQTSGGTCVWLRSLRDGRTEKGRNRAVGEGCLVDDRYSSAVCRCRRKYSDQCFSGAGEVGWR